METALASRALDLFTGNGINDFQNELYGAHTRAASDVLH